METPKFKRSASFRLSMVTSQNLLRQGLRLRLLNIYNMHCSAGPEPDAANAEISHNRANPTRCCSCVTSSPSKASNLRTVSRLTTIMGPEVLHFSHFNICDCISPTPATSNHSYPAPRCHGEALFCARKPPSLISRCRSTGLP